MKRRHRLEQSLLILVSLVVNICFIFTTNNTHLSDLQLSQDVVDNNYDDGIITVATEPVMEDATKHKRSRYPNLCSKPRQMKQRKIPPLINTDNRSTQILQVFTLIRHGSRAPDTPNMKCWGNSTTSFSEYLSCQRFNVEKLPSLQDTASNMVYNKKYVTLATVTHTSHNKKHQRSCKSGLLFDYSYNELKSIGIHMQDAYITTNEGNLKLFDSTKYKERPYNNSTLFFLTGFGYMSLSLQMILYGMFDIARSTVVEVIVHSMDKKNDYDVKRVLERAAHGKSKKIQSKLRERAIRDRYMKSNPSLKKQLQPFERLNALQKRDCLLTTVCNDGKLPTGLDDYTNDQDDSLFGEMVRHSTWEYEHKYVYDDAAYAKWKVRPIVEQMVEGLAADATELSDLIESEKPQLSVYMSGAEYIASFLAVLCGTIIDSMGIPQSSQLLIEHHYIHDNQRHAFRLLWNGKVITDRVAGCELSSDLCDLDVLFHHFKRLESIPS